jgi:type IV secretion system protein VirB4
VDDSKEAQVRELGASIKELEIEGNYFGHFSLSVVIYDLDPTKVETAAADFYKVFSVHDAQLYEEKYNLLNAFLATVPGGSPFNLRSMFAQHELCRLLISLYASLWRAREPAPQQEYLAVLKPITTHPTSKPSSP